METMKTLFACLGTLAAGILLGVPGASAAGVEAVDQDYVKAHVGRTGVVLVDVRSPEVYGGLSPRAGIPGGHIPGAINFPLADLDRPDASEALARAGLTRDAEIIVYCNTGRQSARFIDRLVGSFGFDPSRVKNYTGSMTDWSRNPENPIATGTAKP